MGREGFRPELESLRGIAALIVAMHHGMSAFIDNKDGYAVLRSMTDWVLWITHPSASVLFFFVLSGYVLGKSLERNGNVLQYGIKRAFRILPMFIASIFFAYICITLVRIDIPPTDTTRFFQRLFWPTPNSSQLWDNLVLRSFWINGPSWSIWPEILGSLFLPVLLFAHHYVSPRWRWPLFVVASAVLAISGYRLVIWFYWGFFLPGQVAKFIGRRWAVHMVVFVIGYMILRHVSLGGIVYQMRTIAPTAIGGALMIGAVVAASDFMTWLNVRPIRFVGRVSYSFYLLHWPIFYVTWVAYMQTKMPHSYIGNLAICVISISIALALSALTYALIELSFMDLGKRIAQSIKDRFSVVKPSTSL